MMNETDLHHLRRCIELAQQALDKGDEPFGSLLVDGHGKIRFEDHNHVAAGDATQHPEFAIARWAATHLSAEERRAATVYTSGEHCPMCAAAHGWVGLGRIVYASSSEQLGQWLAQWEVAPAPVAPLPIGSIVPGLQVDGPVAAFGDAIRELHRRYHREKRLRG
ncbi:nucleoside deaminase [Halomonas sp. DP4Y7-1]|nr:nucleoside deaminase [Halomonas sp. DP4Y7-2]MBY6234215.1 nucleoside deaminase [Halomonas sp. DP4Y7-1]